MRIALLYNAAAGRGRAEHHLPGLEAALVRAGHEPARVPAGADAAPARTDLAVIVGGDGTVHHALPALARGGIPFYHFPTGTENLVAREFAMRPDADALVAAIERWTVRPVDLGAVSGAAERLFLVMAGLGPDAGVVHRVQRARRGPIRHASYLLPVLAEGLRPSLPRVTIEVDGREVARDAVGQVVVANSGRYGLRLDPCARARVNDGRLDVVLMPCRTTLGLAAWAARARTHLLARARGFLCETGASIRIIARGPRLALQCDGEPVLLGQGRWDLCLSVRPGAVRVLLPPTPDPGHLVSGAFA